MSQRFDGRLLDDLDFVTQIDSLGMSDVILSLPDQCRAAARIVKDAALPTWRGIRRVVILGMGGSAIGGNLARSLIETECQVPVAVSSDYTIPGYVDGSTLVIASSYSGNTEETLLGYEAARERGARIVVVSTGGQLAQLAGRHGYPWVQIPGGISPRAALGYSLVTILFVLERMELIPKVSPALGETLDVLEGQRTRYGPDVPFEENPMKQLALNLAGKIPVIYGSGGWRGVAAYRWKCQVNENSKAVCYWNTFPELNHNETVGWEYPELTKEFHVVFLRDAQDHPRVQRRIKVTREIMTGRVAGMTQVWAEGESGLAKLMSLVYPGDFASYYLALLYRVDPTPIGAIERLKAELAAMDQ